VDRRLLYGLIAREILFRDQPTVLSHVVRDEMRGLTVVKAVASLVPNPFERGGKIGLLPYLTGFVRLVSVL